MMIVVSDYGKITLMWKAWCSKAFPRFFDLSPFCPKRDLEILGLGGKVDASEWNLLDWVQANLLQVQIAIKANISKYKQYSNKLVRGWVE